MSVGGTTIEILKSLEGQPLKKPSEIGTVGNHGIAACIASPAWEKNVWGHCRAVYSILRRIKNIEKWGW